MYGYPNNVKGEVGISGRVPPIPWKKPAVSAPTDGNGTGAEGIFEKQVPTDDPGNDFAQRRICIRVGAARNRNHRSELGVAKARKSARRAQPIKQGFTIAESRQTAPRPVP